MADQIQNNCCPFVFVILSLQCNICGTNHEIIEDGKLEELFIPNNIVDHKDSFIENIIALNDGIDINRPM